MKISGHIVDVRNQRIFDGEIRTEGNKIISIQETNQVADQYILPGFVDAHVHVESSMLVPSEFARLAVVHGTVATVSDPHEIGNVLGVKGVEYMIENGRKVNFKFYFGAPSCVPATTFETAGAEISAAEVDYLLQKPEVKYLAEMMNWPGVLYGDETVRKKIESAQKAGKPIDGHAPGLRGEQAEKYVKAGMSTDHECFTADEARDKLKYGMKIAIREGSAAKNFDALVELFGEAPEMLMFCSDDKHPDNLVEGHIDQLVKRTLAKGFNLFDVLTAACITPVDHYSLDVGTLQIGDLADFIVVNNLQEFNVLATYINGKAVAERGKTLIPRVDNEIINRFDCAPVSAKQIAVKATGREVQVIEAMDGQLITNSLWLPCPINAEGMAVSDPRKDILKMVVVNRYHKARPAMAFIKNFQLKEGAIASCVGHDSHNIIAVGTNDEDLARAINLIIESQGGVSAVGSDNEMVLPLPVAGIMSAEDGYVVAQKYTAIDAMAKKLGSRLNSPFMTLSFMALLVIPKLKLSDKGLFDGESFSLTNLFRN
ncbi:adenine deaminase [Roseivirga thermotolerans]|uniref:adenine deaminase n=1 Tax=Roseivirga thermotolerans TaxID=1758176 RepID=UPI00273E8AB3|nr:adenine deaminase [Roseivirga thermotolerans]